MADLRPRVVAGIVSAGLTLGVAELLAAFLGPDSAPLHVLGSAVVDHTPDGVREWAITTFGTGDKAALYVIMGVIAVLVAGVAGAIERTTRAAGSWLFAVFGVITAWIAVSRTGLAAALPTVVGVAVGIYSLRALTRRIDAASGERQAEAASPASASGTSESGSAAPERRQVLRGLLVAGGLAAVTGIGGRVLGARRSDVSGERAAVRLPEPSAPTEPVPPGVDLRVPGLTPYLTANDDFYRIDTALIVPQVSKDGWSLRIHGMVDREIRLDWADLALRPVEEHLVTLACVSNPVGGDLIGNARWLGYRVDQLLAEAGPHPDADMVLSHSADGWTAGTPLAVLTDGRDALLAIGMNGEPLPVQHGYPARLVVPGLYGYVSATKWVTELEVTRFDRATAYWTRRGWSAQGPIKTGARIDTPRARGRLQPGTIPIAGVAWAQHRGISAVEVQIDDGPWQQARLSEEQSIDTWRQWVFDWDATPGPHTLRARATDGAGETQTAERRDVIPDGATGYPSVTVSVG
ncbi:MULTISPECIES: molybdopterin-dependent oxidoreductase [Nocardia]|uniref:Molybdopterin-dependent oxidoreductase n=1 Tax=Nocardia implantans TaxID=3108168 RepID=A0ABU6B2N3_9NOCA|nr:MULTISPECIES: molybdopterin-dependent oxidoreductase [unclassified Nocardia]MBF6195016.1 molybdopterin-dependent oxidoreductase [Nocardia beijingensis]MEA3530323.1 molybdopterin-dependent oxidoreductase [Nocardia sp. CDC192]MEB3513817.1 molybdopterin-dependent oxidoreductase [Nocardia sp. CDC186]